jgi:hypothetical protein
MKKVTTTLLVLLSSLTSVIAQDNRVSLKLSTLSYTNGSGNNSGNPYGQSSSNKSKSIYVTPLVGYAHTFKNNIGLGVDLGYMLWSSQNSNTTDNSSATSTMTSKSNWKRFYIGLSAYESFKFKNYMLNLALVLPLEFISKMSGNSTNENKDKVSNTTTKSIDDRLDPKRFETGIYFQPSISRRLYEQLFVGVEMQMGVSIIKEHGVLTYRSQQYTNGALVSDKTSSANANNTYVGLSGPRTIISLSYIFGQKK